MAVQRDRITVFPPEGETVTVDILEDDVSIGTAHAERTTTRELTLPLAISERTSFYVPQGGGPYVVSALLDGQEVAGDGVPVTVSSFPAEIRATVNVAEMGDLSSGSSQLVSRQVSVQTTGGITLRSPQVPATTGGKSRINGTIALGAGDTVSVVLENADSADANIDDVFLRVRKQTDDTGVPVTTNVSRYRDAYTDNGDPFSAATFATSGFNSFTPDSGGDAVAFSDSGDVAIAVTDAGLYFVLLEVAWHDPA